METANDKFRVSIIIPAFNESNKIENCLKSIAKQSYKEIEIILVDDYSTDRTVLIAEKLNGLLKLDLSIIELKRHKERSNARNIGAKKSTGRYLFFFDADMELSRGVIEESIKLLKREKDIRALIIPEDSKGEGFWAKCKWLEKRCYLGDDRIEAARFFDKESFWSVGGWDKRMISGEDWDLTRRIRAKYRIGRIKSFMFHNEYKFGLFRALKKKFYYASVSGIYFEKNPLSILELAFFVFRPAYIRNWRLILSNPFHGVGMFFIKFMELSAGLAGYLFSKLPHPLQAFF